MNNNTGFESFRALLIVFLVLLSMSFIGCGARVAQQQASGDESAATKARLDEFSRRLETQGTRINRLYSNVQDSLTMWRSMASQSVVMGGSVTGYGDDTLMREHIYFDLNVYRLNEYDRQVLDNIADRLAEFPGSRLEIKGFADRTGNAFYNQELSRQRADAAIRYLVERYGVPLNRLHAIGFGSEQQEYMNDTGQGKNKNRRIDLLLLMPAGQSKIVP